uniref:CHK domain-containing protein n=1 Tax=Syphacia muris TaxID=451379 RepID=A0A0N5AYR0_9BILA
MTDVYSANFANVYPKKDFYAFLQEHTKNYDKAMFEKIEIQKYEESEGFNSTIFKVKAYDNKNNVRHMILKVPCVDKFIEKLQNAGQQIDENDEVNNETFYFHNLECSFYSISSQINDVPLPKILAFKKSIAISSPGGILMEDLSKRTASLKIYDTFNIEKILNLTACLAHLHSSSLLLKPETLKSFNLRNRFFEDCASFNPKFAEKTFKFFPHLRKHYAQFYKIIRSREFAEYSVVGISKELGTPDVLVHGDLFCNNILWKLDKNGCCSNDIGAIIDWQLTHAGSIMEDLTKILIVSASIETRHYAETIVFDKYMEVITDDLNKFEKPIPFTKQQLEKAYRLSFINQVFFLLFGISFFIPENLFHSTSQTIQKKLDELACRAEHAMIDASYILNTEIPKRFQ